MYLKFNKHQTWLTALVIVLSVSFLAACGGQATSAMPTADKVEAKPTSTESAAAPTDAPLEPVGDVGFTADVLPIFQASCTSCHGPDKSNGDLRLDTYENVIAGGEDGPVVIAGDPEGSMMIQTIEQGKMPKRGEKLTAEELAILKAWVQAGAQNN